MPSWNDEERSDEDICMVSMDQHLFDEGVNCGVVEWVDVPWPEILQRCLARIWDMYHEQNLAAPVDILGALNPLTAFGALVDVDPLRGVGAEPLVDGPLETVHVEPLGVLEKTSLHLRNP
ncbi:hypothetical protein D1007_19782 [Hordeum vulgare]|nr:hypothetical protein D1007_19782 [Hordeum vulgare]